MYRHIRRPSGRWGIYAAMAVAAFWAGSLADEAASLAVAAMAPVGAGIAPSSRAGHPAASRGSGNRCRAEGGCGTRAWPRAGAAQPLRQGHRPVSTQLTTIRVMAQGARAFWVLVSV